MNKKRFAAACLTAVFFAAPAPAAEPVKIGVLLPFSGVYGGLGSDQERALGLGFDTFGRTVGGRGIVLVKADTEAKPAVGLQKARELILRDRVDLLVGIISSAVAGAVRDYVHNAGVPLFITNAGNDLLTGARCSPWIIRTSFSNSQIVRGMGPWLHRRGYRSAFLMAFDYAAGHQMMDAFRDSFTSAGGAIAGEEYPPLGQVQDFAPYLVKLKSAAPDVTFVFFAGPPAIKFAREYAAFGLNRGIPLAAAGWLTSALHIDRQGGEVDGVYSILNYVPSIASAENAAFQRAHKARFGRAGSEYGVAAYDTARLIVDALAVVNADLSDKSAFLRAVHAVSFNGPRGPFRIDPATNNIIQNIYISQVRRSARGGVTAEVLDVLPGMRDQARGCRM